MDNDNRKPRRKWRRHWLINRRADWLHLVMADKRVGSPGKRVAYALSVLFDERTMRVKATREELGAECGSSPKTITAGKAQLEERGYVEVRDAGNSANIYRAQRLEEVDPDLLSSDTESGPTKTPSVGKKTALHSPKSDIPKMGSKSDQMSDFVSSQNRPAVIPVSDRCDPEIGRVSSQKGDALYSRSGSSDGDALQARPPSGSELSRDSLQYLASSERLEGADDAVPDELSIGPDPDRFERVVDGEDFGCDVSEHEDDDEDGYPWPDDPPDANADTPPADADGDRGVA